MEIFLILRNRFSTKWSRLSKYGYEKFSRLFCRLRFPKEHFFLFDVPHTVLFLHLIIHVKWVIPIIWLVIWWVALGKHIDNYTADTGAKMNEYKIITTQRMLQERFIYYQLMHTLVRVLKNINYFKKFSVDTCKKLYCHSLQDYAHWYKEAATRSTLYKSCF